MSSAIITEIQQIVDRLQQEGHTVATRLENALHDLEAFFVKDKAVLTSEVEADFTQVKTDAEPLVAEVKAAGTKLATEAKADVEADMATVLASATAKK